MSNVKSLCLTNILTNKNHQSFNFIPHYFIAKTAFFQTKILQFGPLKTVDMHYLPNMHLIACLLHEKGHLYGLFLAPEYSE